MLTASSDQAAFRSAGLALWRSFDHSQGSSLCRREVVGNTEGRIVRPLRDGGVPYQGINVLMLWIAGCPKGYTSPMWLTFKQALDLGGHVRKGETGKLVVYAGSTTREECADSSETTERQIRFLKGYTVFNVKKFEGLPAHYSAKPEAPPPTTMEHLQAPSTS